MSRISPKRKSRKGSCRKEKPGVLLTTWICCFNLGFGRNSLRNPHAKLVYPPSSSVRLLPSIACKQYPNASTKSVTSASAKPGARVLVLFPKRRSVATSRLNRKNKSCMWTVEPSLGIAWIRCSTCFSNISISPICVLTKFGLSISLECCHLWPVRSASSHWLEVPKYRKVQRAGQWTQQRYTPFTYLTF